MIDPRSIRIIMQIFDGIEKANIAAKATEAYCTHIMYVPQNQYRAKTETEVGSGTLVTMGGYKGILTASHVAEMLRCKPRYIFLPNGKLIIVNFMVVQFPWRDKKDFCPDMAFMILDAPSINRVEQLGKKFFNLDESIMRSDIGSENNFSVFLMHGNVATGLKEKRRPGENVVLDFLNFAPYIVVPSGVEEGIYDYGCFKIICDIISCPEKTKNTMPKDYKGASGAALWKVTLSPDGAQVCQITLRGVFVSFCQADRILQYNGPKTLSAFYDFVLKCCSEINRIKHIMHILNCQKLIYPQPFYNHF